MISIDVVTPVHYVILQLLRARPTGRALSAEELVSGYEHPEAIRKQDYRRLRDNYGCKTSDDCKLWLIKCALEKLGDRVELRGFDFTRANRGYKLTLSKAELEELTAKALTRETVGGLSYSMSPAPAAVEDYHGPRQVPTDPELHLTKIYNWFVEQGEKAGPGKPFEVNLNTMQDEIGLGHVYPINFARSFRRLNELPGITLGRSKNGVYTRCVYTP